MAILETLPEFARRPGIEGWVRASTAIDVAPLAEEVARLSKENAALRDQLVTSASVRATYNGLTFDELYDLLAHTEVPRGIEQHDRWLTGIAEVFGDRTPALLHALWLLSGRVAKGVALIPEELATAQKLEEFGLITKINAAYSQREYQLTQTGQQFLLRLRQSRNLNVAEELRI